MSEPATNLRHNFSWDDYQTWPNDERWEIIDGEPFAMSPSPSFKHQDIATELSHLFRAHFKGKKCRPVAAPLDVKLSEHDVVQPDLMIICDPSQIKETHIAAPPSGSRDYLRLKRLP